MLDLIFQIIGLGLTAAVAVFGATLGLAAAVLVIARAADWIS